MLLALTLTVNLLVGVMVLGDTFGSYFNTFLAGLIDAILMLAALWLLLRWRRWLPRLPQAATALFGSNTLLSLVSFPVHIMAGPDPEKQTAAGLILLLFLLLMTWVLVVMGHILRHTLETTMANGILLAMGYALLSVLLVRYIFPV